MSILASLLKIVFMRQKSEKAVPEEAEVSEKKESLLQEEPQNSITKEAVKDSEKKESLLQEEPKKTISKEAAEVSEKKESLLQEEPQKPITKEAVKDSEKKESSLQKKNTSQNSAGSSTRIPGTLSWQQRTKLLRATCDDVYCDPESGQLYRLSGSKFIPIDLETGIASLAKNYWGWDGNEIIETLAKKHGVKKIDNLFASYTGFDPDNYICLGTVSDNPENRVFRDKQQEDQYALVCFIADVPVGKKDFDSSGIELYLRNNMNSRHSLTNNIQTMLEKEFPMKPGRLSDFREPGTESFKLPPIPEEFKDQVRDMAESFFGRKNPSKPRLSKGTASDEFQAMEQLLQFMAAVDFEDFKYSSNYDFVYGMTCSYGFIHKSIKYYETSCYDGGSGGTWDHTEWVELKKMDKDWDWICAQNGLSEHLQNALPDFSFYRGILPGEDCQCVVGFSAGRSDKKPQLSLKNGVFLKDPFGLLGVYKFSIYWDVV